MPNPSSSNSKSGILWSFTSAFLWSTTFVSARFLMKNQSIDPLSLSLFRFLLGSLVLFVIGCFIYRRKLFAITLKDIFKIMFLSLFGVVGMSSLLFLGQKTTSAINSSMIMSLCPVMILMIGVFIGEKLSFFKISGILIALLGCLLVINVLTLTGFHYSPNLYTGDLYIFLAGLCWAIYSVFSKPLVLRLGGFINTVWSMLFGAAELIILRMFFLSDSTLPDSNWDWLIVLYIAVFPTALAFLAWYKAMEKIDLHLLNVMQYITPVGTIILAYLLLGEKMNVLNLIGVVLVIAGIFITSIKPKNILLRSRRASINK